LAPRDNNAEQRIILATISRIEKQGLENLTIRSIAKEAGVNSAAISYYFRSKDNLVAMAMKTTLDHLFEDLVEVVNDDSLEPEERVAEVLDYLIDGATRYPGITRAHMYASMSGEEVADPFAGRMNDILTKLKKKMAGPDAANVTGEEAGKGSRELDLRLVSLFSSALLPAIMPSFYREFSGIDFRDSRTRKSYIRTIMSEFRAG